MRFFPLPLYPLSCEEDGMRTDSSEPRQVKEPRQTFPRRTLLRAAAFAGAGVTTGPPLHLDSVGLATFESPQSEVAISHPANWSITAQLSSRLVYPRQSFCLASAFLPEIDDEGDLPDLPTYPKDALVCWLLHYDSIVDQSAPVGFDSRRLTRLPSEFDGFLRFGAAFSGSQRSYLLRLWIGGSVTTGTRSRLRETLRSLVVT
jgi:hypothetical protein